MRLRIIVALLGGAMLECCAAIPKRHYGIVSMNWLGMHAMAPDALAVCVATRERAPVTIRLGLSAPVCGEPPFTSTAPKLELWTWPWTPWPVFYPAIFDVDRQRILRWYKARGFYDTRIVSVHTYAHGEQVDPETCPSDEASRCKLKVFVRIAEGNPVHVSELQLETKSHLPEKLLARLHKRLKLHVGDRFDEAYYEIDKQMLLTQLHEASYAAASVNGRVFISEQLHTASVRYEIDPGPRCVFGRLRVEGASGLPQKQIVDAAEIARGAPYRQADVEDAQHAIFQLGVFSAVRIDPEIHGNVVDLIAHVQPTRVASWQAGVGVLSGSLTRVTSDETYSVPEWDVHLSASYENKNAFGGLRHFRIEDRPALIFLKNFPGVPRGGPRLGNVLSLRFEQPGALERRTRFITNAAWDLGPDPFRGFFRHDVAVKLSLQRSFLRSRLSIELGVENDLYLLLQPQSAPSDVTSYKLPFLEQQIIADARDNPARPRLGAYAAATVQEAFRLGSYGSWNYVRVLSDVRAYAPVFWDVVFAARFVLGALFVSSAAPSLNETAAQLGPEVYRLRGGGANDNRGFLPGELGDGIDGGTRRWEGSLELRVPLLGDFGFVLFMDTGDVHRQPTFRFNHLNAAAGAGLRYFSVLGAIRLDAGWRIPGLQVVGAPEPPLRVSGLPSAVFLTIGQAF